MTFIILYETLFVKLKIITSIIEYRYKLSNSKKNVFTDLSMVFLSDGNSEHVVHGQRKNGYSEQEKIRFVTALDLFKCLK